MNSIREVSAGLAASLADRYRIVRELGQGGMATVYLATDVRHDRAVALKVLRPELAAALGAERFLAEIRTTAKLQHPNILPLHDSGEANGALFYVMPFVQGETLRERLDREGQLPVAEAVRIAIEVAGALDYAHRQGVIHRDIKPANILLHDGRALVADFGIALAAERTGQHRLTETGLSLGTPAYMSPEQAMGEPVIDGRTDIYALGCVLYEMLIGEPPFRGPTAQAIIARVATEGPRALTSQRHTVPLAVEAAVMTALEKLPADRFATGQELVAALENRGAVRLTPASGLADRVATRWKTWGLAGWVVAALGLLLPAIWMSKRPSGPRPVARHYIAFPPSQVPGGWGLAFTPDGSRLVYPGPNKDGIYVKQRDQLAATLIAGTDSADGIAISPNGEWVAFTQRFLLKKVRITGGDIVTLDSGFIGSTVWLDDTTLIYRPYSGETRRIPATGGRPTTLFRSDPLFYRLVTAALPNARGLLFIKCSVPRCAPPRDLWILDLRTRQERRLLPDVVRAWYLPTGHVAVAKTDGRLYAVAFDLERLEVRGTPVPVLERISMALGLAPQVAISDSGDLVAQTGGNASMNFVRHQMVEVDATGRAEPIDTSWTVNLSTYDANQGIGWALAPDGVRLAIGLYADNLGNGIWIKRLPHGPASRVSTDESSEFGPRWTVDGRALLYVRHLRGVDGSELWQRQAAQADSGRLLVRLPNLTILDLAVSRDGRSVILGVGRNDGGADLMVLQPGVDGVPRPLLADPRLEETSPALSPDGRWLAYVSTETGRPEVYIRPFPNINAERLQVSNSGGQSPVWGHKGDNLFYIDGARNMMAAAVTFGPSVSAGNPRKLFHVEDSVFVAENRSAFEVMRDDRRFIMAREVGPESPAPSTFILVEHWFDEVKEKLRKER
jgi:eukaryotic-like serine/threonine-protein kinase